MLDGRLNGVVTATRSFGDFWFKQKTAKKLIPDIIAQAATNSGVNSRSGSSTTPAEQGVTVDYMLSEPEVA